MKPVVIVLLGCAVLALTGCSSPSSAKPSPSFTVFAGIDANKLAAHVPGCKEVTTADIGAGSESGLSSAATCVLGGHKVYVASWSDGSDSDVTNLFAYPMYWAQGDSWTVFIDDDPTPEMQVTNDAVALLRQGGAPTINLDAAKTVAKAAVKGLGGQVGHNP